MINFAEEFKKRTKKLALDVVKLFQALPKTDEARIMGKQLLRSACSVAANYRAVCRARSDAEFYSKISIVVEEADEVVFWLEMLTESEVYTGEKINKIKDEANQIMKIMSSSRKTLRNKKSNDKN